MPPKIVTKIILLFLFIFLLLSSAVVFVVSQPKLLADTALYFLKKNASGVVFKEVVIKAVH